MDGGESGGGAVGRMDAHLEFQSRSSGEASRFLRIGCLLVV